MMSISVSAATPLKQPRTILIISGLLGSLGLLLAVLTIIAIPADPGGGIVFGMSGQRLILVGSGLIGVAVLGGFVLKAWRDPLWADAWWDRFITGHRWAVLLRWLSIVFFSGSYILVLSPLERFAALQPYLIRVYPYFIWLLFFSGLIFLISILGTYEFNRTAARAAIRSRKHALLIALTALFLALSFWNLSQWFDLYQPEEYTYGAGVPVLGLQVLIALGAALGIDQAGRTGLPSRFKRLDLWACLAIWIVAAILWVQEPAPPSYFNPGPYPPNHEYYPFSDAAFYDVGGQYLLIGEGLNLKRGFERPLYMQFLSLLHMLAGQEYGRVTNLQAAIFAVFPALLYLMGKEIAGRPLGIGLSVLAVLRGINSIRAASMIDLGSPKQMLTDFPTAIGAAVLVYLTVKWLKRPGESPLFVFFAGGVIGLLSLIRTNALLFIAPVAILVLIVYGRKLWRTLAMIAGLIAMMVFSILPWGFSSNTSMLDIYILKIRNVIQQRYQSRTPLLEPQETSQVSRVRMTEIAAGSYFAGRRSNDSGKRALSPAVLEPSGLGFIPRHIFHNLLTSFLILPSSPRLDDLRSTVREEYPYWGKDWDGSLSGEASVYLTLQLIILMFGLGMAWKRAGLAGIAPLLFFLTYQLANALGRTSGGRYIVPVDWIVLVYYLLGLLELFFLVFGMFGRISLGVEERDSPPANALVWSSALTSKTIGVLLSFTVIGLLPTITASLFPVRYSSVQSADVLAQLAEAGHLLAIGVTRESLDEFAGQPSATIIYGRALYPRFYQAGKGELDSGYPFRTLPFPRLAFTVISPRGEHGIVFPMERSQYFPNAADVLILGCYVPDPSPHLVHVDALVIFLLEEQSDAAVYIRQPSAPLQCPAPPIECNDNKECRSVP